MMFNAFTVFTMLICFLEYLPPQTSDKIWLINIVVVVGWYLEEWCNFVRVHDVYDQYQSLLCLQCAFIPKFNKQRRVPIIATLVTFGISSLWGSLLSGGRYYRNFTVHKYLWLWHLPSRQKVSGWRMASPSSVEPPSKHCHKIWTTTAQASWISVI